MSNLNGKVAIVTGASRGIGAAIVRKLADEGAQVFRSTFWFRQRATSGLSKSSENDELVIRTQELCHNLNKRLIPIKICNGSSQTSAVLSEHING